MSCTGPVPCLSALVSASCTTRQAETSTPPGRAPRAEDLLSPLLDWGSADLVYVHYGKIWFPVFVAFTLGAFVVYRRHQPAGFEKWVWRAALGIFLVLCAGVFLTYWTQWTGNYEGGGIEPALFTAAEVTSLGSAALPVAFAFGILGRRIARAETVVPHREAVAA